MGSQPANNVFIRRRRVDIACDFAVDAVKTGELEEVRLLQMDRIFVSIGKRGDNPDSAIEGFAASRTLSKFVLVTKDLRQRKLNVLLHGENRGRSG